MNKLERKFIKLFQSNDKHIGYNMTEGGEGGRNEASMEASRLLRLGKTWEDLYGDKAQEIRDTHKESLKCYYAEHPRIMSKETNKKISKSHKKKWATDLEFKKEALLRLKVMPRRKKGDFYHTDATKDKLRKAREGKTYDEMFGIEKSKELKKKRSVEWEGEKNPNFIKITIDNQIKIWQYIIDNPKKTMKEVSYEIEFSEFLVRKLFRQEGIKNIQRLKSNTKWVNVIQQIIERLKNARN